MEVAKIPMSVEKKDAPKKILWKNRKIILLEPSYVGSDRWSKEPGAEHRAR
jgi:hypothetical protein